MKKLFLILFSILVTMNAFAATYQMWFNGTWESTVQYNVKPIYGSTTSFASPVVNDASGTFIANGESKPVLGIKPESNSAAWTQI